MLKKCLKESLTLNDSRMNVYKVFISFDFESGLEKVLKREFNFVMILV